MYDIFLLDLTDPAWTHLELEEIRGDLHVRWLQEPSNMGTAYISLFLEGSWTPLKGSPQDCVSIID